MNRPKRVHS